MRGSSLFIRALLVLGASSLVFLGSCKGPGKKQSDNKLSTAEAKMFRQIENKRFINIERLNLVSEDGVSSITDWQKTLYKNLDIEFAIEVLESLNGVSINQAANQLVKEKEIGKQTGGAKGLLLLVALKEKAVRFEVGYDLEGIFPDSFIGYIENEQMRPFFEEGKVGFGIEATVEMIASRAYNFVEQGGYDPEQKNAVPTRNYSGGAGAKRKIEVGVRKQPLRKAVKTQSERDHFGPAPSPEVAMQKYFEIHRKAISDPSLGIYSKKSQDFYKNWTVTSAQMKNWLNTYDGQPYKIKIKGDKAIVYYPAKKRRLMPHFLKQERGGWVFASYLQYMEALNFTHKNYWYIKHPKNPYREMLNELYRFDQYGYPHPRDD